MRKNTTRKLMCYHCYYKTPSKSNLLRHITTCRIERQGRLSACDYQCTLCGKFSSARREVILSHYQDVHYVAINPTPHVFCDVDAFLTWKSSTEKQEVSEYVRVDNSRRKDGTLVHYYRCHRDGCYKGKGRGIRRLKLKGSNTLNSCCPASMKVAKSVDGTVNVIFISTHVGHDNELSNLRLPKEEREALARKIIAEKVPLDTVLDGVKNSAFDGQLQRVHLINRRDLKNIIRHNSRKQSYIEDPDYDDRVNFEDWICETQQSSSDVVFRVSGIDQLQYEKLIMIRKEPNDDRGLQSTNDVEKKKERVSAMFDQALSLCCQPQHFDCLQGALNLVISSLEAQRNDS